MFFLLCLICYVVVVDFYLVWDEAVGRVCFRCFVWFVVLDIVF